MPSIVTDVNIGRDHMMAMENKTKVVSPLLEARTDLSTSVPNR